MKRFIIYTLIFVMIGSSATVLLADQQKRNVKQHWGKCTSIDADGVLSAEAYIDVNIEYPGERGIRNAIDAFFNGYGIEYEAYAKVLGDARDIDDYEGEYECYAWVPNDEDHEPRETWAGYVKRKVKAEDSISLAENDEEWAAADKARYGSWADIQADTDLSQCTAWGDINGASPEKNWQEWIKVDPISINFQFVLFIVA